MNHDDAPFTVAPGTECDLVAEWKIMDARWRQAFAGAGLDPLRPGEAYEYQFNLAELSRPLVEVVKAAGWTWRPVPTRGGLSG